LFNKPQGGEMAKNRDQINGLLDKGCSFEGKIVFDGTVQINGEFSGEITSEGILIVGQDARVSGEVKVDTLICYGTVTGKVDAKTRIEIHVPSVVTADITTRTLMIAEGALFQGRCNMHQEAKQDSANGYTTLADAVTPAVTNGDANHQEAVVM